MSQLKTCRICGVELPGDRPPILQNERLEDENLASICSKCLMDDEYRASRIIIETQLNLLGKHNKKETR